MRPVDPGSMNRWHGILAADLTKVNDLIAFLLGTDEFAAVAKRFLHHYIPPEKRKRHHGTTDAFD